MTLHRVKEVPRLDWAQTTAAEVMLPLEELKRNHHSAAALSFVQGARHLKSKVRNRNSLSSTDRS